MTWTIYAAVHELQSTWNAEESPQAKKWWLQKHCGQMEQWWQIPQVFVRSWMDWGTDHSIRWGRIGRPFQRCNKTRKKSEREVMEAFFECRRVFKDHWISAVAMKRRSKHAKDCIMNIQRSLEVETNLSLLHNKSSNGLINNLKALRNTVIDLKLLQDGDTIFPPPRIYLRHHDGNQAATCGQLGTGIRGNHYPGLNSDFFFPNCSRDVISLARNWISWQSTEGVNSTLPRTPFLLCPVVVQSSCHWLHALTSRTTRGSRLKNHGAHC